MSSSLRRLYEDLRSISVTVVYPPGEDRDVVVQQLQRIGCRLKVVWPFPAEPPAGVDVLFFQVSQDLEGNSAWNASAVDAHGVITKPFRSSGILSTLVLARASQGFQQRQQSKIEKLESTIKSRRQIEKAIRVLVDYQRMTEAQAYEHMRERATGLRVTVAEVASMLLETHEAMEKLGFAKASVRGKAS